MSHDQRTNAYAYAHTGAAIVIEEQNLAPHVLISETRRVTGDPKLAEEMGEKGTSFNTADAARLIGTEVVKIALSHEEKP